MDTIFLSYVREDESLVLRLADELSRRGATVWRDRDSIEPGTFWEESIRTAIENGTYFVPCFSRNYIARERTYMDDELRLACRMTGSLQRKAWLVPVSLDGSAVPLFDDERRYINAVQHIVLHPSWD